jgi:DNA-binding CsgD family transcriptional regulator
MGRGSVAGKHHQHDRIGDLIGQLYDASLDPRLWSTVGPVLARTLDAPSAGLIVVNPGDKPHWLSQTDNLSELRGPHEAYYHRHDVWAQRAAQIEMSRIFVSQELIPDAEFARTEFYQDFCRVAGVFRVIGTVFPICNGTVGILGIHRARRAADWSEADRTLVHRVFPHLKRALELRQHLAAADMERQAAFDALERTGVATLVVVGDGRVLYASVEAEKLLREGGALQVRSGKLTAASPATAARLAQLIEGAVDTATARGVSTGGALKIDREDRLPLTMLVAPFRPARDGFGAPVPAAIVFVRDPERLTAAGAALQALFGLTPAEASIAVELSQGRSMDEIVLAHGVSINTAKTHLKHILGKTGTTRQAELVALLLRSVAALDGR